MGKRASAAATKRIQEAIRVLEELGLPRQQLNERSALTLLSLLGLKPNESWTDARAPLIGGDLGPDPELGVKRALLGIEG